MRKENTQKGITLVALIITIIIMLILVGISLNIAVGNGIFKVTQESAKQTEQQRINEIKFSKGKVTIIENGIAREIDISSFAHGSGGGSASGNIVVPENVKEGDIVTYEPVSAYTSLSNAYSLNLAGCTGSFYTENLGEWKVLSIDKTSGVIKIIPKNATNLELQLEGEDGYNNAISALNSICGILYGNTENTDYLATAVNITVEDINGITGYAPTSADAYYSYETEKQENFNPLFKGWININKNYWLASTYEDYFWEYASPASGGPYEDKDCYVRKITSSGNLDVGYLGGFEGNQANMIYNNEKVCASIRPIVTLTPKV